MSGSKRPPRPYTEEERKQELLSASSHQIWVRPYALVGEDSWTDRVEVDVDIDDKGYAPRFSYVGP